MLSAEHSGYDNLLFGAYKSVSEGGWTVVAVVLAYDVINIKLILTHLSLLQVCHS